MEQPARRPCEKLEAPAELGDNETTGAQHLREAPPGRRHTLSRRNWFAFLVLSGCVTTSQRIIDARPWLARGYMESREAPRHPKLDAPMGVGPDPALGCVPVGSAREEEL